MNSTDPGRAAVQARQEMESLLTDIVVAPTVRELKPLITPLATATALTAIDVKIGDLQRALRPLSDISQKMAELSTETLGPDGEPSLRESVQLVATGITSLPTQRDVTGIVDGAAERVMSAVRPLEGHVSQLPLALHELKKGVGELPGEIEAVSVRVQALAEAVPTIHARVEASILASKADLPQALDSAVQRVQNDAKRSEDRLAVLVTQHANALMARIAEVSTRAANMADQLRMLEARVAKAEVDTARKLMETAQKLTETGVLAARVSQAEASNAQHHTETAALEARLGTVEGEQKRGLTETGALRSEVIDWRQTLIEEQRTASRRLLIWMGGSTVIWVLLTLVAMLRK